MFFLALGPTPALTLSIAPPLPPQPLGAGVQVRWARWACWARWMRWARLARWVLGVCWVCAGRWPVAAGV